MIQPSRLKLEMTHDIAEPTSYGDLSKHHHNKLFSTPKDSIFPPKLVTFMLNATKIMSINQLQQLTEYSINMGHGLILLSCQLLICKVNTTRMGFFRPILFS